MKSKVVTKMCGFFDVATITVTIEIHNQWWVHFFLCEFIEKCFHDVSQSASLRILHLEGFEHQFDRDQC